MLQVLKNKLKNQKGFTLIELLAVIVILGILAAIAIPSIMGIINNSKKDAQVANAQQMVSASKNAVASNDAVLVWSTPNASGDSTATLTLSDMMTKGYLDSNLKNPDDNLAYDPANSLVLITKNGNSLTYKVTLKGSAGHAYLTAIDSGSLTRSAVL